MNELVIQKIKTVIIPCVNREHITALMKEYKKKIKKCSLLSLERFTKEEKDVILMRRLDVAGRFTGHLKYVFVNLKIDIEMFNALKKNVYEGDGENLIEISPLIKEIKTLFLDQE